MYSYEMETKENKIQNKNKIELEQIHLSYIAFTQQLTFSMLSKTMNLIIIIYAQKRFPLYIFFDLVYLFACLWPYPYFFYPLILARHQEFLTRPQNVVYGKMPLGSVR